MHYITHRMPFDLQGEEVFVDAEIEGAFHLSSHGYLSTEPGEDFEVKCFEVQGLEGVDFSKIFTLIKPEHEDYIDLQGRAVASQGKGILVPLSAVIEEELRTSVIEHPHRSCG